MPTKPRSRAGIRSPNPRDAPSIPTHDREMDRLVQLDGLAVRRRRHENGWSPRELVIAIENASIHSSGLRRTLTPNQIQAIEERAERVSYASLLLLADGLDCDPVDLLASNEMGRRPRNSLLN